LRLVFFNDKLRYFFCKNENIARMKATWCKMSRNDCGICDVGS
jgi:hypothetical protein